MSRTPTSRASSRPPTSPSSSTRGGVLEGFGDSGAGRGRALADAVALVSSARALGKPAAMIGVGAGQLPTRSSRLLARALVRRADLFVLRDNPSAHTLASAGAPAPLRVGADPAWVLLEDPRTGLRPSEPARVQDDPPQPDPAEHAIITLDRDACGAELAERLARAVSRVRADGVDVRLQPWRGRPGQADDARLAGEVAVLADGPVDVMAPPGAIGTARTRFEGGGLVVGLRRHAVLAAATAGVPSLAVAHEPGLRDLAQRLGQPWVPANAPPEALAAAMLDALGHPPASRSAIQGQVASAEEGFRLLRLLLSGGDSEEANELTGLPLEPAAAA